MTEALQKVTRETKVMSADKYDITAQGETEKLNSQAILQLCLLRKHLD